MSKLGIVTVVTNEKQNLKDFHNSLAGQTFTDFTVYFVNNNSTDGSADYFRQLNVNKPLDVKFIELNHNSGFSGGCNIGAEKAISDGCRYLFLSNNDLVLDIHALEELFKLAESDSAIACTGPVVFYHSVNNPDTIQEFGGKIDFKRGTLKKHFENTDVNTVSLPEAMETDFIGGGVCLIKADIFKKAGMYESSYFAYFDEIDLSYRLKETGNYRMLVTSKAKIWHNHNWEGKNRNRYSFYLEYYLSERNKFLYYRKYRLYGYLILMLLEDLLKFPRRLWWFKEKCDFKLGMYYIKGMFDGLLNRKGKPKFSFMK